MAGMIELVAVTMPIWGLAIALERDVIAKACRPVIRRLVLVANFRMNEVY